MKVVGIGIDIVEVKRIKQSWKKFGNFFLRKVYDEEELNYCLKMKYPELHLAARFAAKEAIVKALGTGMQGVSWKDFVIGKEVSGKPKVKLSLKGKGKLKHLKAAKVFVSLSHTRQYVVAQAIII